MTQEGFEKKMTVLVVDDTPENITILSALLKGLYRIKVAINGEKALQLAFSEDPPDLILLDILMPGIDGFEVCRRLKADPGTEKIPIIFISALNETADKVRGLGLGAVDYVSKPFQPEEVIARVNTHLTIHRLTREVQKQKDEMEHELQVVSQLQRDLLPEFLPQVEGIKLAVHYETSRYAGGDYYDLVELPNGRLAILVADAEGHSAPAAVMMAMTCALFRSASTLREEPDRLLTFINENLCKVNKESFVTAICAIYDPTNRTLKIARAGHPLPILYRSAEKKAREVPCPGVFAMGWDPYDQVPVTEIQLQPGDQLLFYTDGVTERFNEQQELYEGERLLEQLESAAAKDPGETLQSIIEDLTRFAGHQAADDDQAMVLLSVE